MIKEKIYYYIRFKLESPLSVGNGDDNLTDHDCMRNSNGDLFIPATSIAGVFSHYLNEEQRNLFAPKIETEKSIREKRKEKEYEYFQSPYFISDAILVNSNVNMSIRDGVKLTENKTAEKSAKYNFEVIETGAEFDFRIELTIRDGDNADKMKEIVDFLLNGFNSGEIVLGLKSKRGYGKVSLIRVYKKSFDNDIDSLLKFNKYNVKNYDEYILKQENLNKNFDYLEVELEQIGGLSIRRYSSKAGEADFEHIKSNGTPVIPGTSWAGLIRGQVERYVNLIENQFNTKLDVNLDHWFGREKQKNSEAVASNIIVEESIIEHSKEITLTRNKIDRFSGGASNRALFTEKAVFNGTTKLGIKIKKGITYYKDNELQEDSTKSTKNSKVENNSKIVGLIALVLKDIDNGLIALGGQTSVGRGIFKIQSCKLNNEELNLDKKVENIIGGE